MDQNFATTGPMNESRLVFVEYDAILLLIPPGLPPLCNGLCLTQFGSILHMESHPNHTLAFYQAMYLTDSDFIRLRTDFIHLFNVHPH